VVISRWILPVCKKIRKNLYRKSEHTVHIKYIVSDNSAVCEIITKSTGRTGKDIGEFYVNYTDCKT